MKKQIFLIGYRATGKSTVGKVLSNLINWKFVDLDNEIEMYSGRTIKDIFDREGEKVFREIESEVLRKVSKLEKVVISTGGGVIIKKENRDMLKEGFVILLESSIDTIVSRMIKDDNRPSLTDLPLREEVIKTLSERKPLYEEVYNVKYLNENVDVYVIASLIKNVLPSGFLEV
ncbi:MAG: shikimate kinase [Brevinematia bacterium]|jgi:shikimate kinase